MTIVGATSGDTGGAAIEAFRGRDAIDIFMMHPEGRVSDVQRRQMTTAEEANVFNIAIEGTFDDCQNLVKAMFNDLEFRDRLSLAAVNSIIWARIAAQIVYYFTSAVALGSPARAVNYCVPTGNFGDIFAGYAASRMGLPVGRLVIATNVNDILARALETGRYESRQVVATSSPSMDIQISSNFERLVFEASGRDAAQVRGHMDSFTANGSFSFSANELDYIRSLFHARRVDEDEVEHTIREMSVANGYITEPHTAVGIAAVRHLADLTGPTVTLATAHPAKFPDAVLKACGSPPDIPERLGGVFDRDERYETLPNDIRAVSAFVSERSRAAAEVGG